jgi:hypothetical protein
MRQAFNFYRSYWDVAKELNDKDRLAFYDALLTRQFTGEETELKGLVKFAYLSQKHSIDKQIKGYEDKTKRPLQDPSQDPTQGGTQGPSVQEKEKGKEKGYIPSKDEFIAFALEKMPDVLKEAVGLKYESWVVNDWSINRKGKMSKIVNWKSSLINTLTYLPKDESKKEKRYEDMTDGEQIAYNMRKRELEYANKTR